MVQADPSPTAGRGVVWCNPHESGYTFDIFLADVLDYLTEGEFDATKYPTGEQKAEHLCGLLRHRPTLVILDGAERWLRRWVDDPDATGQDATPDDRRGHADGLELLLADAPSWTNGSALILSTRALPQAWDDNPPATIGTASHGPIHCLEGLQDDDAVELLTTLHVRGTPEELVRAANEYDNHPLALTLLARLLHHGRLGRRRKPDGLEGLLTEVEARHRRSRPLLRALAACVTAAPVEMLCAVPRRREGVVRERLSVLAEWGLVRLGEDTAEPHALLRRHFLDTMSPRRRRKLRLAIAKWFAARPIPDNPQRLEEVMPLVLATRQALAAEDPKRARRFLDQTAVGMHHTSLDAWLSSFGHLAVLTGLLDDLATQLGDLVEKKPQSLFLFFRLFRLASTTNNRGNALTSLGKPADALADYGRAIEIWGSLVDQYGRDYARKHLGMGYSNRSMALGRLGRFAKAVGDCSRGIEILEALVRRKGRQEYRENLANGYNNRGLGLWNLGKLPEAAADCAKAIEIWESLVRQDGRADLRYRLGLAYSNRGSVLLKMGKLADSLADLARAVEILETLVGQEGRDELRKDLAMARSHRSAALARQGGLKEAVADSAKAVEAMRELVDDEGRSELVGDLARCLWEQGNVFGQAGKMEQAWESLRSGVARLVGPVREGFGHLLPLLLDVSGDAARRGVAVGKAREAAEEAGEALGLLAEAVEGGEVSESLRRAAREFLDRVRENIGPLGEGGLDKGVVESVAKRMLGEG